MTYIRWGNSTCPYGADIIYSGVVAGSSYDHQGAIVDPLCLPPDPQYLEYQYEYQGHVYIYGAEYQTDDASPINNANDCNVPCALCIVYGHTTKITIHHNMSVRWDGEEIIMVTSWLDIMVTMLLPSSLVRTRVYSKYQ